MNEEVWKEEEEEQQEQQQQFSQREKNRIVRNGSNWKGVFFVFDRSRIIGIKMV